MVISLPSRPVMLEPCPLGGSQEAFLLCRARSLVRLEALTEFLQTCCCRQKGLPSMQRQENTTGITSW